VTEAQPLRVVLCWHMHQPQYQDLAGGEHLEPWTYLHGIKDYVDMAVHLESCPGAAAVVNFSPVLLEQLADFSQQLGAHLRSGAPLRNRVLRLLAPGGVPRDGAERELAVRACLRANRERLIERFPAYRTLADLAATFLRPGTVAGGGPAIAGGGSAIAGGGSAIAGGGSAIRYASDEFIVDLAVWYHLAWLGETVRLGDPRVEPLIERGRHYEAAHCRVLLEVVADVLTSLIPRYRRLFGSGQVELSVTPYGHPIVPLVVDFASAREALPGVPLPETPGYPGGVDRARWHVGRAIQVFSTHFGVRPQGCWPSEGSVSEATLQLLEDFGFEWAASGEAVLRNSLAASRAVLTPRETRHDDGSPALVPPPGVHEGLHCAYTLPGRDLKCFFRHDGLSDLIGFTYSKWHGDDAAANLIHRLEEVQQTFASDPDRVVAVILDGENAWEYFPFNAYFFLKAMYRRLSEHPGLRLTTFSRCIAEGMRARELPRLVAGSWVYGNFSTWIGQAGKNRAWDLLCEAKRAFDRVVVEGTLDEQAQRAAERQLGICEGSDWCWWFGDENPAEAVASFDELYRRHLANLYRMLGEEPPESLAQPIAHGGGAPEHGGAMKRSAEVAA